MDVSLQSRIKEFESAKLPKNLIGYIYKTGRQRSDFTDYREWKLYAALYESLMSLRGKDELSVLAPRLFTYLDRHPPSATANATPIEKRLTRKERRKLRSEKLTGTNLHPSTQTSKTEPSAAASTTLTQKKLTRTGKKKRRSERVSGTSGYQSARFKKAKPSVADMVETWKSSPTIGLGLESSLPPPPKARREEIKIDKHTQPPQDQERSHILYAAGWSLNSSESQD